MSGEWTVTVQPSGLAFKVTAIHRRRGHVIHRDKFTAAQVESYDPAADWAFGIQQMRARTTNQRGTS